MLQVVTLNTWQCCSVTFWHTLSGTCWQTVWQSGLLRHWLLMGLGTLINMHLFFSASGDGGDGGGDGSFNWRSSWWFWSSWRALELPTLGLRFDSGLGWSSLEMLEIKSRKVNRNKLVDDAMVGYLLIRYRVQLCKSIFSPQWSG